jgi:hypothetical protein
MSDREATRQLTYNLATLELKRSSDDFQQFAATVAGLARKRTGEERIGYALGVLNAIESYHYQTVE